MSKMIEDRDLNVALEAARKGVETIRSYKDKDLNIDYKGSHDLVTDADVETEEEIVAVLKNHCPDDQIIAEESAADSAFTEGRAWIIDPIDGTTNFSYNFPVYCVSIALYEGGEPKAAVVIEVNRDEVFCAAKGKGAWLNGSPIRISGIQDPDKALVGTGFPYHDYSLMDEYFELFKSLIGTIQGIRRPGAASYDLCCVAAGRFQGFYEYSLKAWDVAAAALIIQEAGGVVTDWEGGGDWLFGERIVAGNEGIHRFLLEKITKSVSAENLVSKHHA